MKRALFGSGAILVLCLISGGLLMADPAAMISSGKTVKFHYTLKIGEETLNSTIGSEPVSYVQGDGKIIPGLERRLEGMKAGEKKLIVIPQEDAYGPVDPTALMEVPILKLPEGSKSGSMLSVNDEKGEALHAVVKEIRGETAVLDFNHPLAGKELQFDVEIVDVA